MSYHKRPDCLKCKVKPTKGRELCWNHRRAKYLRECRIYECKVKPRGGQLCAYHAKRKFLSDLSPVPESLKNKRRRSC